jgi:hypothetical protein
MLTKLERQRRRLQAKSIPAPKQKGALASMPNDEVVAMVTQAIGHPPVSDVTDISFAEMTGADLVRPKFLDRSDPLIAEKMTAARKRDEAEARSRMPLTGRAALAAINAADKAPPKKKKRA